MNVNTFKKSYHCPASIRSEHVLNHVDLPAELNAFVSSTRLASSTLRTRPNDTCSLVKEPKANAIYSRFPR